MIIRKLATIISYVFHPLLMCTYLVVLLFLTTPYRIPLFFRIIQVNATLLVFLVCFSTFVIPSFGLFLLKISGGISSLLLDKRKERIIPMLYISAIYGTITYIFYMKIKLGEIIPAFFAITTLLITIATIITLFWKISLHGIALGGVTGFIINLNQYSTVYHFPLIILLLLFCSALVLGSRLKLKAHSPKQVYLGYILGIGINFLFFYLARIMSLEIFK